MTVVLLNDEVIESFVRLFLLLKYDNPQPIPSFHRSMWNLCASDEKFVAIAAPRGHAKSTAITHAYVMCEMLFRRASFCVIVSDTEAQAASFLGDIKAELLENDDIKGHFGIQKLLRDSETDVIVRFTDGHKCRLIAKGSEQKVRGLKWNNQRPDLVVGDDLENDELVANKDRRTKFRNWVQNALIPVGSDSCRFRFVGTVLHLDSWLNRTIENEHWATLKFRACDSDFSNILWPEKFPESRLKRIRSLYESEGNLDGWASEYMNDPVAEGERYFNDSDFLPISPEGRFAEMEYVAAADFAISESERSDYTVIMVAGIDSSSCINIVDVRRGRWDSMRIIDELISVQQRYNPQVFVFETEKIDKAIGPFLERRMAQTGQFLTIHKIAPTKSKTARGQSIRAAMRSGNVRFDKDADWYEDLHAELHSITPAGPKGTHDDMFDAFSYIGLGVKLYQEARTPKEIEEDDYFADYWDSMVDSLSGRSAVTGY